VKLSTYARVLPLVLSLKAHDAVAENNTCGFLGGSFCVFKPQDTLALYSCLSDKFGNSTVGSTKNDGVHEKYAPSPLNSTDDGTLYYKARRVSYGLRNPAAIIYAENTQDVVDTVNCAREAGYKVSPRGRGHSTIGAAAADGAVVIDLQNTCNVEEMVASIDKTKSGPHLIEGTKYIATIKAQAGCANANWLAAVYLGFDVEEGGMASIGTCPSVGLVGFSLGGGLGDSSPLAGFAADLITEYEMVLADGSVVTASEDTNEDLYWANRGGGGGNGVITSLTFKVVQTPSPGSFTYMLLLPSKSGNAEWHVRFTAFMYDHPESYRFGGAAQLEGPRSLLFLGPLGDGIEILTGAGLLDPDLMEADRPTEFYKKDFNLICESNCTSPLPPTGLMAAVQTPKQGQAQAVIICINWLRGWSPDGSGRSRDVCKDLGVDDSYCECVPVGDDKCYARSPNGFTCSEKAVVDAILETATDPTSWISHHGYDLLVKDVSNRNWPAPTAGGNMGGLLLPRLENSTLRNLANNFDNFMMGSHLAHGASHMVPVEATALPWRGGSYLADNSFGSPNNLDILLKDKAFGGDSRNLNGYYSYIGPEGLPNWEQMYFGGHVGKLKKIKAKYDPTGLFDKPMQISGSNTNPYQSVDVEKGDGVPPTDNSTSGAFDLPGFFFVNGIVSAGSIVAGLGFMFI